MFRQFIAGAGAATMLAFGSNAALAQGEALEGAVRAILEHALDSQGGGADHTILIDSSGHPGATGYTIEVGRSLEQMERFGIGGNDRVSGGTARGRVSNGKDGFRVFGDIYQIQLDDPAAADVYVDGQPVSADSGGGQSGGQSGGQQSDDQQSGGTQWGGGGSSPRFAGRWDTNFGELRLHRIGDYVVGDYADKGVMIGQVSRDCMAGVFTNAGRNGMFRLRHDGSDGIKGRWAWHGEALGGSWTGTRAGPAPSQMRNFTRGGGTTSVIENERDVFDGRFDSEHGTLNMFAEDLFLVGDYAERGVIVGMWDGDSFVGRFTNGARTGWFDFAFLSRNGTFREGAWGWIGSNGGGSWDMKRISSGWSPKTLQNVTADVNCN